MSVVVCLLCGKRVSEWAMASGKCEFVAGKLVHTSCLQFRKDKEHAEDDKG